MRVRSDGALPAYARLSAVERQIGYAALHRGLASGAVIAVTILRALALWATVIARWIGQATAGGDLLYMLVPTLI